MNSFNPNGVSSNIRVDWDYGGIIGMVHFGRKDLYKFRGMVGATAGRFDLGTCDHVLFVPASPIYSEIPYPAG